MNNVTRRLVRALALVLVATGLSACCFHGHHGYYWGGHVHAPVPHCHVSVHHCR